MAEEEIKRDKKWYKNWWGILILFFIWPFFFIYWVWKKNWNKIIKIILIALLAFLGLCWYLFFYIAITNPESSKTSDSSLSNVDEVVSESGPIQENTEIAVKNETEPSISPSPSPKASPKPSPSPSQNPSPTPSPSPDPYKIFTEIGKEAAGENSNVSVFNNDDGSIDVINNIQLTPEITWGLDAYTRKWVTDFLSKSYTSGLKVRYILVTVSFLHTGIPATRVGLGVNQAEKTSQEEWKEVTPGGLCRWISGIQIGDDVDPLDPDFDPSNWAFAKNWKCN